MGEWFGNIGQDISNLRVTSIIKSYQHSCANTQPNYIELDTAPGTSSGNAHNFCV